MSKHPSRSRGLAFVAAGAVVLLWGASYPAIGIALGHVDPVPLGAVRYAVAGVVFAVLLAAVRPPMPRGADLVRALLSGALGIAVYNALLNSGQASISAGVAGFIASAQPVVVAALATLTLKERPGPLAWLGTAVAFVGVASIAAGQPGGLRFGQGASLVALAAVSSALSFVLQRPLPASRGMATGVDQAQIPRDALVVFTGVSGSWKVVARLRDALRRGAAPIPRVGNGRDWIGSASIGRRPRLRSEIRMDTSHGGRRRRPPARHQADQPKATS